MGPEEFKEVTMVMGKDARKLHRMGILTGERERTLSLLNSIIIAHLFFSLANNIIILCNK